MDIQEYNHVFLYLSTASYPDDCTENYKRTLRKKCEKYSLHDGNLYFGKSGEQKLVVTKEKLPTILRICHIENGGHLGRNKTISKISERYYWVGIVKDVSNYLAQCEECQHENKKTKTTVSEMINVPVPENVWRKIGIDLIGPFLDEKRQPLSSAGYRYVLTMVDYFSKWPEAVPLYSKSSEEIVSALKDTVYRFGVMTEIISDCGGEFNSKVMDEFTKSFGIKHLNTSPYYPQSNGMTERFNQTIKSIINKSASEGKLWHLELGPALFAYRTSVHESTKVSPFEAMYARKPVLIKENIFGPTRMNANEISDDVNVKDHVDFLNEKRVDLQNKMSENIKNAQSRQKKQYDARHCIEQRVYKDGEKVLLKNFRRKKGMGTVHQTRYKGPYEVYKYCGKGCYKLKDENAKIIGPYNGKSLKLYIENADNVECNDHEFEKSVLELNNDQSKIVVTVDVHHVDEISNEENVSESEEVISCAQDKFSDNTVNFDNHDNSVDLFSSLDTGTDFLNSDCDEIQIMQSSEMPRKSNRKKRLRQSSIYEYYY